MKKFEVIAKTVGDMIGLVIIWSKFNPIAAG
jgi:hypothetical protein